MSINTQAYFYVAELSMDLNTNQEDIVINSILGRFTSLEEASMFAKEYGKIKTDLSSELNFMLIQGSDIETEEEFILWFNNEVKIGNIILWQR